LVAREPGTGDANCIEKYNAEGHSQSAIECALESNRIKRVGWDWYMVCIQKNYGESMTAGTKLLARGQTLPELVGIAIDGRDVHISGFHGRKISCWCFQGSSQTIDLRN
jgi:hypothetical protein